MIQNFVRVMKNGFNFDGRAGRREYWMFFLANFVFILVGTVGVRLIAGATAGGILTLVYLLATFIPGIAVAIRRMHDTNRSGWMLLLGLIPAVGGLIVLYFMIIDGTEGSNQYGPSPKEIEAPSKVA